MSRTNRQQEIADSLAKQFDIDGERILFLNQDKPEEPWLNAEALTTIARRSGMFREIDEGFSQYVTVLDQVIHTATVVDAEGRRYTRTGVATRGESSEIDDHGLAAGRAISAALTAAGFNPLRPGAVVVAESTRTITDQVDEARLRTKDLKQIHSLGVQKGLITLLSGGGRDLTKYRDRLADKFGVRSAGGLDAETRASVINYLQQLPDAEEDEFAAVA